MVPGPESCGLVLYTRALYILRGACVFLPPESMIIYYTIMTVHPPLPDRESLEIRHTSTVLFVNSKVI